MNDDYSPTEALSAIQGQRDHLAERAKSPAGYHVTLGLVAGIVIASTFLQNRWVFVAVYIAGGLAVFGLIQYYKRSKGMWVDGTKGSHPRKYALTAGLFIGGGLGASMLLEFPDVLHGAGLIIAAIVFPVVTWLGYRWDKAYEAELRAAA
ncbi:MAG: hypothetical protein WBA00_08805 [Rhodococcus sp. (in: high G+C Gram-positive bacteria)]